MIEHVPVLIGEILDIYRAYPSRGHVLDCTLGLGGYAEAILSSSDARLIGIDQDEQALAFSRDRLRRFGDRFDGVKANFRSLPEEVTSRAPFGAFFFDLGVSNLQLTDDARGFSFQSDGPLDMRMDLASNRSAADIVNSGTEGEIADIFWKYGEERHSRRLARAIVRHREAIGPIMRTETLVAVIRGALPAPVQRKMGGHPARRVFQALRIAVNEELCALQEGLQAIPSLAAPGALLFVVSYHSLEDRIVKTVFRLWKEQGRGEILSKRLIRPSSDEVESNRKSRSAKLRVFRFNP